MARPQNQKRRRIHESLQENTSVKKADRKYNFSPSFWDNLSKVSLTPRALRELDRRNNTHSHLTVGVPEVHRTELARFARHGGQISVISDAYDFRPLLNY